MKPKLTDWLSGEVDVWDDPVWSHNAKVVQAKLNAVLFEAHLAGIQVEVHDVEGSKIAAFEVIAPPEEDGVDGQFLVASPDPDREPSLVLEEQ